MQGKRLSSRPAPLTPKMPDLAAVVEEAWTKLPEPMRADITAMVKGAHQG